MMDIDALVKGIGFFKSAITVIKQAIELLPDNSKKADATLVVEKAEREFRLAEGQIAQKLDYEICRNHFPPEIMLSEDDMDWICPECKNKKYTGPSIGVVHMR